MWPMRLSVNKPKPVASALKGLVDDKPNFKVPRFKRRSLGQRRRLAIGTVAIHTKPLLRGTRLLKLWSYLGQALGLMACVSEGDSY